MFRAERSAARLLKIILSEFGRSFESDGPGFLAGSASPAILGVALEDPFWNMLSDIFPCIFNELRNRVRTESYSQGRGYSLTIFYGELYTR